MKYRDFLTSWCSINSVKITREIVAWIFCKQFLWHDEFTRKLGNLVLKVCFDVFRREWSMFGLPLSLMVWRNLSSQISWRKVCSTALRVWDKRNGKCSWFFVINNLKWNSKAMNFQKSKIEFFFCCNFAKFNILKNRRFFNLFTWFLKSFENSWI